MRKRLRTPDFRSTCTCASVLADAWDIASRVPHQALTGSKSAARVRFAPLSQFFDRSVSIFLINKKLNRLFALENLTLLYWLNRQNHGQETVIDNPGRTDRWLSGVAVVCL
jgi:hypothetical protein